MKKTLQPALAFTLGLLAAAPAFAESHGNYWRHPVPGFGADWDNDGKRFVSKSSFDEVGTLRGCYSPPAGRLFRGGAPDMSSSSSALQTLKDNHVGYVIDLRIEDPEVMRQGDPHGKRIEEDRLAAAGIGYINLALGAEFEADGSLPREVTLRIRPPDPPGGKSEAIVRRVDPITGIMNVLDFTRERLASTNPGANPATFIHCMHGSDRTGMLIALIRGCPVAWRPELKAYWGTDYPALRRMREEVRACEGVRHLESTFKGLETLLGARAGCSAER